MNSNHFSAQKTQQYIVDGYRPGEGEYLGTGGIRRSNDQTFVSQFTNPRPYHEPQPKYLTKQVYIRESYNPYKEQIKYELAHTLIDIGKDLIYWGLNEYSRHKQTRISRSIDNKYKPCNNISNTHSLQRHPNVKPFPQRKAI